jgi:hypothetical protein
MTTSGLASLRKLVKDIDPASRVSKFGDWDGEFVVRVRHELTKTEKVLTAAGYVESAPRDIEGGRFNWWTVLTVKKVAELADPEVA